MGLAPGTCLGPYEVLSDLGAGGMGEVYRAHDMRLKRDVAIKILPEAFSNDPDRLARFQREAEIIASLNHPNIAAIHGLEESSGARALVLELVEGPTLADRIAHGPIPLDEALPIARQIAEALEAAHERGVIHRDLKPANIKIAPDGTVKVLDFGLAKALEPNEAIPTGDGLSQSPTITSPALVTGGGGMLLGTAAYMSPEQAKGREADKRSDVWAFGCVLFEMLTATRPFAGEDVSDTLAAVLMRDPDWTRLPANLPASIRTLLRRCLERDRKKRMAGVAGALLAMDEALVARSDAAVGGLREDRRTKSRRVALVGVAAALLGAVLAGSSALLMFRPVSNPNVVRFQVDSPSESELHGGPLTFGVSPDGLTLAFITGAVASEQQLWIRPLGSAAAQPLPGAERASRMLWSPDSQSILFASGNPVAGTDGRLRRIDVRGGPAVTIAEFGIPGAWSRQGDILFRGRDGRLYRVDARGGDAQPVTELDKARNETLHHAALFLNDGRRFVFQAQTTDASQSALYLASLDAPSRVKLLDGLTCARYAGGHLLYQREGTLMAQPFDQQSGRLTGTAAPLVEGFGNPAGDLCAFSVSADGALAYVARSGVSDSVLTWVNDEGRPLGRIGMEGGYAAFRRPSLSKDGKRLAVSRREGQGGSDVWIIDLERDVPTRFTTDPGDDDSPIFTPDGSRVVYRSNRKGESNLYQRGSGGAGSDEVLIETEGDKYPNGFSPLGDILLFVRTAPGRAAETWSLQMKDPSKPVALVSTGFPAGNAVFSPNGRWFAYCEGDTSSDQVYVQPYPQNGTRVRLSRESGSSPQWSADGKTVYFTRADNHIIGVEVFEVGGELRAGQAQDLFQAPGTFVHRGIVADSARGRFLVPIPRERASAQLHVILNWQALVKR